MLYASTVQRRQWGELARRVWLKETEVRIVTVAESMVPVVVPQQPAVGLESRRQGLNQFCIWIIERSNQDVLRALSVLFCLPAGYPLDMDAVKNVSG